MPKDQNIILEIDGEDFLLRENVEILSSMTTLCNTFTILTMQLEGTDFTAEVGKECKLKIDDETVIDGQIDHVEIEFDPTTDSHDITISGRDKTAVLVDCSYEFEPNEWKQISVGDVIKNLCAPFEIDVFIDPSAESATAEIVETFKMNEGAQVVDDLTEICRNHAILPLSLGDGRLTITQSGTKKADEILFIGSNIIWSKAISSNINRYSNYYVKGHDVGNDNKTLSDYIEPSGEYADGGIESTRPFVIFADGPVNSGQCQLRAQWEACARAGMSRQVIYQYDSFYQKVDGDLWRTNTLVEVNDNILGVTGQRLIAEVRYTLTESSRSVFLTCVSPATFTLGDPSKITATGG